MRRIAFIDMLRGVAALLVVFHHAFVHFPAAFARLDGRALHGLCAWLSDLNVEAVLLFFVVSGFSIRLSVERLDLGRSADLRTYASRRLRRIVPLYLFSLAFAAACVIAAGVPTEPRALSAWTLAGNLFFLQTSAGVPGNWVVPFAGNGPLWSLSYEMFYYLLFPAHLRLVRRPKARLALALAISAAGVALNRVWPNPFAAFAGAYAVWYAGVELAEAYLGRRHAPGWLPAAAWLALSIARWRVPSATIDALWVGLTFLLLGHAIVRARARLQAWARGGRAVVGALAWVGGFSYALYLLHFPVLRAVGQALGTGPGPLFLAVAASGALALAAERLAPRPRSALRARRCSA